MLAGVTRKSAKVDKEYQGAFSLTDRESSAVLDSASNLLAEAMALKASDP